MTEMTNEQLLRRVCHVPNCKCYQKMRYIKGAPSGLVAGTDLWESIVEHDSKKREWRRQKAEMNRGRQ